MSWLQLTILTTTAGADMASQLLLDAGSAGTMIEDKHDIDANQRPEGQWDIIDEAIARRMSDDVRVSGWFEVDHRLGDRLAFVEGELRRLREMDLGFDAGKLTAEHKSLDDEDWAESWKRAYRPVRLGRRFVVRPSWAAFEPEPGDHVITIDPGMAFGTGTHETTGMCVELVEKYVRPGDECMDIGTGTGILAIAAAHMGAGHVLATDLDAVAVRVAEENVRNNGFADRIDVRCGDLLEAVGAPNAGCDVVIANIIADVIIGLAAPVKPYLREGGVFICSGIAVNRLEDVLEALRDAGFAVLDAETKGEWSAVAARK